MDRFFSQEEQKSLFNEFVCQDKKAGIIGVYCEEGYPFYYADEEMTEMLGCENVEELRKMMDGKMSNIIHPDDLLQMQKDLGSHFYEGMTYESTYRMRRRDGSWFWTVDRGKVITAEDGSLVIISVCQNMTDFLERYRKLEQRNFTSEYMLGNLPGGYHRCSMEEGYPFLYVSEHFLNILGWTSEELKEKFNNCFWNLLHPDDRELASEYVKRILGDKGKCPYQDEIYRLQGKDGYHWVSDTTMKLEIGDESFFQGCITDITFYLSDKERKEKELERALKSAQLRYEIISALGNLYNEILVVNLPQGDYMTLTSRENKREEKMRTGNLPQMLELFADAFLEEDQKKILMEFWNLDTLSERLRGKKYITQQIKLKSGIWYSLSVIVKKRDAQGILQSVIITSRDINERKCREIAYKKKLEDAVAEAQHANEAKTIFLRRMSHDIRTPINGIIGLIEMADRNIDDHEKLHEYKRKVLDNIDYLLSIVNNVLDMGKLESGNICLEHQPFDLVELLGKLVRIVEMQASENGINFRGGKEMGVIYHHHLIGSPVYLNRILMNLINNAVKYTRVGGTITIYCKEISSDENTVLFQFVCKDTGVGMSKEFQKRMFEPYAQEGKETSTSYSGSGLGLPIVKEIIRQMKGTITFHSEEGVGTTFTVTIPFEIDKESEKRNGRPLEEEKISTEGKKVLIVEDNELNTEIAKMLLEDEGLLVDTARNGKEAVEMFGKSGIHFYDFIFMDIMMPVLDGLEACRQIRKMERPDAKTVPVFAMTANAFQDDIQSSREAGMDAHLTKPLEKKKIQKAMQEALRRKRERE